MSNASTKNQLSELLHELSNSKTHNAWLTKANARIIIKRVRRLGDSVLAILIIAFIGGLVALTIR